MAVVPVLTALSSRDTTIMHLLRCMVFRELATQADPPHCYPSGIEGLPYPGSPSLAAARLEGIASGLIRDSLAVSSQKT